MESPRSAGFTTIRPSSRFVFPSKVSMEALEMKATLFSRPAWTRNSKATAQSGTPAMRPTTTSPNARNNRITDLATSFTPRGSVEKMQLKQSLGEVAPRVVHAVVEVGVAEERFQAHVGPRHDEDAPSQPRLRPGPAVAVRIEEIVGPDQLEPLAQEIRDFVRSDHSYLRLRRCRIVSEEVRFPQPGQVPPCQVSVGAARVVVPEGARMMVPRYPQRGSHRARAAAVDRVQKTRHLEVIVEGAAPVSVDERGL